MPNIVVVGAQWGDEAKGKLVDVLASHVDVVVRYQGGNNAGHTVITGGQRFILQLIPSGILRAGKHAVIGPGVVIDPAALVAEIDNLAKAGVDVTGRLHVSNRAHVIFPYHRQLDRAAESARGQWAQSALRPIPSGYRPTAHRSTAQIRPSAAGRLPVGHDDAPNAARPC